MLIPVQIQEFVVQDRAIDVGGGVLRYYEVDCILLPIVAEMYDFEVMYCGNTSIIAKSQQLGEICLAKKKYAQFEIGKLLNISFNATETYWDGPWIIKPQIA